MSERAAATQRGITATPRSAVPGRTLTRPRSAAGDPDTRYAGAISLAAALGGILLGGDRARSR